MLGPSIQKSLASKNTVLPGECCCGMGYVPASHSCYGTGCLLPSLMLLPLQKAVVEDAETAMLLMNLTWTGS